MFFSSLRASVAVAAASGLTGVMAGAGAMNWWEGTRSKTEEMEESTLQDPGIMRHGAPESLVPDQHICYSNHCLQFDARRRTPIWVAEHLSREKIFPERVNANRKKSKFRPDETLHASVRASNDDFWNSGWSRGHMAPAGNNKFCQKSMDETFLLSNVVPQDADNNGDFWNRLEIYCRDLSMNFADVFVVSGPLWLAQEVKETEGDKGDSEKKTRKRPRKILKHEVIGSTEISVPTHLYKVILVEDPKKLANPMMASFVVPNRPIHQNRTLKDYKVALEDVERNVGFKFFGKLDRSKADDLCTIEGCNMMDYRKFQSFYIRRGITGARGLGELDRYWRRATNLNLVTPDLLDLYEKKRTELDRRTDQDVATGG